MSNSSDEFVTRGDDPVEALLEQAAPRPAPPSNAEQMVRNAVHAEWQAVSGRQRTRRRMTQFAIAATVLLAVAVTFNALQVSTVQPMQVASINENHGSIYLVGEQSLMQKMSDLSSVFAGQIIETGDDAGIGLEWDSGGSLRMDKNTRVEFTARDSIYLRSGRIYFDSERSNVTAAITGSGLEIETEHGLVRHLGTQYMTWVDTRHLTVSVREGQVTVEGNYYSETAQQGEQLQLTGSARPTIANFKGHGEAWSWIEETSPQVKLDGKPVHELLRWVSRETGLELRYEGDAEQTANAEIHGTDVVTAPREKLFLLATANLQARIDEDGGTINVSAIDTGSRP